MEPKIATEMTSEPHIGFQSSRVKLIVQLLQLEPARRPDRSTPLQIAHHPSRAPASLYSNKTALRIVDFTATAFCHPAPVDAGFTLRYGERLSQQSNRLFIQHKCHIHRHMCRKRMASDSSIEMRTSTMRPGGCRKRRRQRQIGGA